MSQQPRGESGSLARMRSVVSHLTATPASAPRGSSSSSNVSYALNSATRWNGWGYEDTKLYVNAQGDIEITGERYGDVFHGAKGRTLPHLRPWAERVIGLDVKRRSFATNTHMEQLPVHAPRMTEQAKTQLDAFLKAMAQDVGVRVSQTLDERVRHSHGQTCEEIFRLRHEQTPIRVPDAVVWPQSHAQVQVLVKAAVTHGVCLIPHGGGTNVSNALTCNPDEQRAIVSIDLRDMARVLHVDKENMVIRVETGITGLELHERLQHMGLTLGHEPDSWEFSTLGGWVATRASGMKKNIYGNIEDLVINVKMVTTNGTLERACNVPRVSMGPDVTQLLLGSEGILGIFTEVTLRVRPFPSCQVYDSLVFPDMAHGIAAMHEITRTKCVPASIRLLDNTQFQLGQALKPTSACAFTQGVVDFAKKTYVTKWRGYDVSTMCAATVLMEGTEEEVERQQKAIQAIAKKHHGMVGGAESGKRGYFFTYIIAYLRDFALDYYFMSESFETAVPWSNIVQLMSDIKRAIHDQAAAKNVQTPPLVACRVTQVYETGVCVYVYYGINYFGVKDALSLFHAIEQAAVGAIVANGGSLSHHHGIGKHRKPWLASAISQPGVRAIEGMKHALDPTNVFAANNIIESTQEQTR
ncbi:TPA: hypothetical protein N0F65_010801 [Lagenidium giganteum]|uniref:Alkylglycerone-phosphate synthase n=1 Tax=Lagenidium giganteum TaxID=4803 RepID=A0AAV2YDB3_9STRA|nr:TPA: hypothetical protein N0F65_010801 [Lagenidium giganteum]